LPHIQTLYTRIKSQGAEVVAMNYGDEAKVITDYWSKSQFAFPAVQAAPDVHQRFGVQAYPTNYVVDGRGKVLARFIGYDENGIKGAFRSAGVQVD